MITSETRVELKQIQSELRKPFPTNQHEVRDLPGSNRKWVYLRWQTIRERLDEVCPDWVIDYSEIQYLANDAICRCGITILGIRKEALASVPISILSTKDNEMTRGSAADRLAAEALKNAAECWGIGRYLDDQEFTIRYLWEHMHELNEQMQGEVRCLSEQYKIQGGGRPKNEAGAAPKTLDGGFMRAVDKSDSTRTITEAQQKRLWAIAKSELKLSDEQIKTAFKQFGFEKTEQILKWKYEDLIAHLRAVTAIKIAVVTPDDVVAAQDLYPRNNEVVRQVRALTKHDPAWIVQACKHYGYSRPGAMPQDELEKLIVDMCVDWAVRSNAIAQRPEAHTSITGAISFAKASGQSLAAVATGWLNRHQSGVPV